MSHNDICRICQTTFEKVPEHDEICDNCAPVEEFIEEDITEWGRSLESEKK